LSQFEEGISIDCASHSFVDRAYRRHYRTLLPSPTPHRFTQCDTHALTSLDRMGQDHMLLQWLLCSLPVVPMCSSVASLGGGDDELLHRTGCSSSRGGLRFSQHCLIFVLEKGAIVMIALVQQQD
jgi:hypothetical protein